MNLDKVGDDGREERDQEQLTLAALPLRPQRHEGRDDQIEAHADDKAKRDAHAGELERTLKQQRDQKAQNRAADDIVAVLEHFRIERAHIVGLSMGGFAALHLGFRHPTRARSLTIAGCGYGAEPTQRETFRAEAETIAAFIRKEGMAAFANKYAYGPSRVQFENKDPRGFAEFKRLLAEHSATGSANTQLGCQRERPSLYHLVEQMKALNSPTLILTGDEDFPCLAPGILMKRNILTAALSVMPNCGHTINLENPDRFNAILGDFLAQVDSGRWPTRDPRAVTASITGMR